MPIILPDSNDPMIQAALQAEQQDRQMQAVVAAIQNQILVSTFTQFALEHLESGEPLTLEAGREIAEVAQNASGVVINGYSGFLFERLGFARMGKVEKTVESI